MITKAEYLTADLVIIGGGQEETCFFTLSKIGHVTLLRNSLPA